jgi:hypothetical protein
MIARIGTDAALRIAIAIGGMASVVALTWALRL